MPLDPWPHLRYYQIGEQPAETIVPPGVRPPPHLRYDPATRTVTLDGRSVGTIRPSEGIGQGPGESMVTNRVFVRSSEAAPTRIIPAGETREAAPEPVTYPPTTGEIRGSEVAYRTARTQAGEDLEPGVAVELRSGKAYECPTLRPDGAANPSWAGVVDPFLPKILPAGSWFQMLMRSTQVREPAPPPTPREAPRPADAASPLGDPVRPPPIPRADPPPTRIFQATRGDGTVLRCSTVEVTRSRDVARLPLVNGGPTQHAPMEIFTSVEFETIDEVDPFETIFVDVGLGPHTLTIDECYRSFGMAMRATTTVRGRLGPPPSVELRHDERTWRTSPRDSVEFQYGDSTAPPTGTITAEELVLSMRLLHREMRERGHRPTAIYTSPDVTDQLRMSGHHLGIGFANDRSIEYMGLPVIETRGMPGQVCVVDGRGNFRETTVRPRGGQG